MLICCKYVVIYYRATPYVSEVFNSVISHGTHTKGEVTSVCRNCYLVDIQRLPLD